jgi:hypothetical protein
VHVRERVAPSGLDEERDDRGDHEQRLDPFAQQDQERACEDRPRRQARSGERVARLGEERLNLRLLPRHVRSRRAVAHQRAERHHLALGGAHEPGVDVQQARLDQLEALEIGLDREPLRGAAIASSVGGKALGELRGGDVERRRPRGGERLGMGEEIRPDRHGGLAEAVADLVGGQRRDVREIGEGRTRRFRPPRGRALRARVGRGPEARDQERE